MRLQEGVGQVERDEPQEDVLVPEPACLGLGDERVVDDLREHTIAKLLVARLRDGLTSQPQEPRAD